MNTLNLEIFINGQWKDCGKVWVKDPNKSRFSSSCWEFDLNYFFENASCEGARGILSPSVRYELDLVNHQVEHWPSFLLDLIPQGAARSVVCKREKIVDAEENDFEILLKGGLNPVGNVRVKSEVELFKGSSHPGFSKEDLLNKNERFLEHAEKYNAIVIGTSGAQGVSPKFLLNADKSGKWHCDGALKDSEVAESYLVKLPRGRVEEDRLILEAEEKYMMLARAAGANVNNGLIYEKGMLFIPRFDREKTKEGLTRFGLESLSSAAGHYEFGKSEKIEHYLEVIAEYSSEPEKDILEFVRRDFLNIVLGNTDNHGRNTAFLKKGPKEIRLSPLFDFAPMVMDPEMIPRVTKWKDEKHYIPDFDKVESALNENGVNSRKVFEFFLEFKSFLETMPQKAKEVGLSETVFENATRKYPVFLKELTSFLKVKK